ncbi:MAG: sulfatase-like hydrolase/transferase [Acidobacteria bacterium]|nr:sulfatase-like hydrolase/transferase [Acidobacteriota bacterium]
MLTRRELLATAPAVLAPAARPNVVVFMTDQESAQLPGPAKLPHRERLNARGVEFTSAFCNTPQCSAARSSLLTGLEPHRTGVVTNVDGGSLGKSLSPKLTTAGHVFRDAGYCTGYFGKWHLGSEEGSLAEFGFPTYERGRDKAVSEAAAKWIRAQTAPWLAWVSILNPHDIYGIVKDLPGVQPRPGVRPPATALANLEGKPAEQRQYMDKDQGRPTLGYTPEDWLRYRSYYLGLMEKADDCLGSVMGAIRNWDNTIFVYIADHGDALGEHGLPFKGPFMYEPLIRIPFVVCAPGLKPARRDDLAVSIDLAPTLASLAGLRWPAAVAGRDLSRGPTGRDAVFLEYYSKQKWVNPIRTIRTRRWKLNWYDSGHQELYDLREDPHEARNLASDPAALKTRRELEARLNAWRAPLTKHG